MNRIFVDTSGWANFFDTDEPYYALARNAYKNAKDERTRLVTTNYVIAELVSLLTSPFRVSRPGIIEYINLIKDSSLVDFVYIDEVIDGRAWKLLTEREDKKWSLVACSSFIVMKEYDITEAMTNDHNFEQAGFIRLLK